MKARYYVALFLIILVFVTLLFGAGHLVVYHSGLFKWSEDYDTQHGHNTIATQVYELRQDIWAIQTSIAPKDGP